MNILKKKKFVYLCLIIMLIIFNSLSNGIKNTFYASMDDIKFLFFISIVIIILNRLLSKNVMKRNMSPNILDILIVILMGVTLIYNVSIFLRLMVNASSFSSNHSISFFTLFLNNVNYSGEFIQRVTNIIITFSVLYTLIKNTLIMDMNIKSIIGNQQSENDINFNLKKEYLGKYLRNIKNKTKKVGDNYKLNLEKNTVIREKYRNKELKNKDKISKILKINELLEKKIINEEEFNALKEEIIDREKDNIDKKNV